MMEPSVNKIITKTITIVIIVIIVITIPTHSLECYDCEPCNDIGNKVTCPADHVNCVVAFGYLENLVGIKKGCSKIEASPLGTPYCKGYIQETFQGHQFSNATGCLCGSDNCNDQLLPTGYQYMNLPNYPNEMAGNLKCLQCNPCPGPGVEVICANGVLNCFQATGLLNGAKTLIKGCEDPANSSGKQGNLKCTKENSIKVFDHTLQAATNCLCSSNGCNVKKPGDPDDDASLSCYVCSGDCVGIGVLQKCSDTANNCYIGQGINKDTGNNVTIRGCAEPSLTPRKLPTRDCGKFDEYIVQTKAYQNLTFCGCSENGCNIQLIVPPVDAGLKCYQCNPCSGVGALGACPADSLNCFIGIGMKDGNNVTIKGCADQTTTPVKLPTKMCNKYNKYTIDSVVYDNVTACGCPEDGCNLDFSLSSGGGGPGGSGLLKCYECFPCTDAGNVVTCPKSALNCYYFEGINETASSGGIVKGKGCAGPELIPSVLNSRQCMPFSSYKLNGTTFTNVKACGCSTDKCNDEMTDKLQCHQCSQCRDSGQLVTCASKAKNCFVFSGKLGLFEFSTRGCYEDLPYKFQEPVCTKYNKINMSGRTFRYASACVCPTSKCNLHKIPQGAIYSYSSGGNDLVSMAGTLAWGVFILVQFVLN